MEAASFLGQSSPGLVHGDPKLGEIHVDEEEFSDPPHPVEEALLWSTRLDKNGTLL